MGSGSQQSCSILPIDSTTFYHDQQMYNQNNGGINTSSDNTERTISIAEDKESKAVS